MSDKKIRKRTTRDRNSGELSKGDEIRRRRQGITEKLRSLNGEPVSTPKLLQLLGKGESKSDLRTLQRDLDDLEVKGFVREFERKGNLEKRSGLWLAGETSYEEDLDRLVTFVAVNVFFDLFKSALPLDMRVDIKDVLDRAKGKVAAMSSENTTMRWLRSLKVEKPYHYFEAPIIDGDVRSVIEQGIVHRQKVRLTVSVGPFGPWPEGSAVVSISHYILKLPDRPSIVVWRDDDKDVERPNNQPTYYVLAMETITDAELVDERASWPPGQEPRIVSEPSQKPTSDWLAFEFRASRYQMERWIGTWLLSNLKIIGFDDEGWAVCRIACPAWEIGEWGGERDNLLEYLASFPEDVELLAPFRAREHFYQRAKRVVALYEDGQEIPDDLYHKWVDSELAIAYARMGIVSPP